jgi:hypothetical protein
MPGPLFAGDELNGFPASPDEEVGRNLETSKPLIIRVRFRIKRVCEQLDDPIASESPVE